MKIVYPKKKYKEITFGELPFGSTFLNGYGKLRMKVPALRTLVTQLNVNTVDPETGTHDWTDTDEVIIPVKATVTIEVE